MPGTAASARPGMGNGSSARWRAWEVGTAGVRDAAARDCGLVRAGGCSPPRARTATSNTRPAASALLRRRVTVCVAEARPGGAGEAVHRGKAGGDSVGGLDRLQRIGRLERLEHGAREGQVGITVDAAHLGITGDDLCQRGQQQGEEIRGCHGLRLPCVLGCRSMPWNNEQRVNITRLTQVPDAPGPRAATR